MRDRRARNLFVLVISVWASLFAFYGFLAYRARLWSPLWAIQPATKAFAAIPHISPSEETSPIEHGRRLYRELRCGVCHGPDGEGGVKNPNADPEGMIPNLFDLADAFTWNDLKDKIKKGAHPAKLEEDKPEAPLGMPSWKEALSDKDINVLAHYLLSLKSPPGSKTQEEKP